MRVMKDLINGIKGHSKGLKCFVDMNKTGEGVKDLLEPHVTGLMTKIRELETISEKIKIIANQERKISDLLNDLVTSIGAIESFCVLFWESGNKDDGLHGIGELLRAQTRNLDICHSGIEDSCIEMIKTGII